MKEKISIEFLHWEVLFSEIISNFGNIENFEDVFKIEFSAGVLPNGEVIFMSDDHDEETLTDYDGKVDYNFFKDVNDKIYDMRYDGCRFDVYYDEDQNVFTNPKIVTRGYKGLRKHVNA